LAVASSSSSSSTAAAAFLAAVLIFLVPEGDVLAPTLAAGDCVAYFRSRIDRYRTI